MNVDIPADVAGNLARLAKELQRDKPRALDLPDVMPDGTDIDSVESLAALMGKSLLVASYVVLSTDAYPTLKKDAATLYEREVKAMQAGDDNSDGIALMVQVPWDVANKIAYPGGLPPEELHVTVAYFGNVPIEGDPQFDNIEELGRQFAFYARDVCREVEQFDVQLNGITRFSTGSLDPVVVNADSSELEVLRRGAVKWAQDYPEFALSTEHGYTPHMTLGYIDPEDPMPIERWEPVTFRATTMIVAYGKLYRHIALGDGSVMMAKDIFTGAGSVPPKHQHIDNIVQRAHRLSLRDELLRPKRRRSKKKDKK